MARVTQRWFVRPIKATAFLVLLVFLASTDFPHHRLPAGSAANSLANAPRFVYREFGINADTLWLASAADPSVRTQIATVPHAPEWGIFASLSPDGRWVAYTAISPQAGTVTAATPAELWIISSDGKNRRQLATGVDLRVTPVWSPDSRQVIVRRSTITTDGTPRYELLAFSLDGQARSTHTQTGAAVLPVGFAGTSDTLYFVQLTSKGTELLRTSANGVQVTAHLADDLTRDWRLSPDGSRIAFLTPDLAAGRLQFKARISRVDGTPLAEVPETGHFSPVWHPQGQAVTVGNISGTAVTVSLDTADVRPVAGNGGRGLDLPVAWSADAAFLALRHFDSESPQHVGRQRLIITNQVGTRVEVVGKGETEFVGWMGR